VLKIEEAQTDRDKEWAERDLRKFDEVGEDEARDHSGGKAKMS
jgi:hypothetical protein